MPEFCHSQNRELIILFSILNIFFPCVTNQAQAQVVPDRSLGRENSQVKIERSRNLIEGGALRGANLFHSFQEFNVNKGQQVYFQNPQGVDNIFSRVTGNNSSQIFGTLGVNGLANLFLLNPNGIVFGAGAKLDLNGAFTATTAEGITFADGSVFSAKISPSQPLLTISVPSGVQFNNLDQGNITINNSNLNLKPNQDISLLTGNLNLTQGIINGFGSNITLDASRINLRQGSAIRNQALNNSLNGDITIKTDSFALKEGSRIESITSTPTNGSNILIDATNRIEIDGFSPNGLFSGILSYTQTNDSGKGGDININISGSGGQISLSERGFVATLSDSQKNGGAIAISTPNLSLIRGGQILSQTRNKGQAGDINITASESLFISKNSNEFVRSPFSQVLVYDLNNLNFRNNFNPNVAESGANGIPYVSIARTPQQILANGTPLGQATQPFDYYRFSINQPNSRIIADIDRGDGYENIAGSVDTEIFLLNGITGELIVANDDFGTDAGGEGTFVVQDSFFDRTLNQSGEYILAVGEFDTLVDQVQLLEGNALDVGDTYILNLSVENQGLPHLKAQRSFPNHNIFNPNYGNSSQVISLTRGQGSAGQIDVRSPQIIMQQGAQITTTTFAQGSAVNINLISDRLNVEQSKISSINRGQASSGDITLTAKNINLTNRSSIVTTNLNQGKAGDIFINSEKFNLLNASEISSSTFSIGDAGDINIKAQTINLKGILDGDETTINSSVSSPSAVGNAGDINIETNVLNLLNESLIRTNTRGKGNAGMIVINTEQFTFDNALIDASTRGIGDGGNVFINANEFINIIGPGYEILENDVIEQAFAGQLDANDFEQGGITVVTDGGGKAGEISIHTARLEITEGGLLGTTTLRNATGEGGNINLDVNQLKVDDSLIATGTFNDKNAGSLTINANYININRRAQVLTSTFDLGEAGDINIDTNSISIFNGGTLTVNADGEGNGGSIFVTAKSLLLDQSLMIGSSGSGQGGNINLQVSESIKLKNGSQISTRAGIENQTSGDGGNIFIRTPIIIAFPDLISQISANAFDGEGGNINIFTQSILGNESLSINASSQLGIDGIVNITNPNFNPTFGLIDVSAKPQNPDNQIVAGCSADQGNRFVIRGKGGLPMSPSQSLNNALIWEDLRESSTRKKRIPASQNLVNTSVQKSTTQELLPAQGWIIEDDGTVILTHKNLRSDRFFNSGCTTDDSFPT